MFSPAKWLQSLNRARVNRRREKKLAEELSKVHADVFILTPPHTRYIAQEINTALAAHGISSYILMQKPPGGYRKTHHIVICAQVFDELPADYTAFQLEQSGTSQWFTPDYMRILSQARYVLDYSRQNVEFLVEKGIDRSKVFYVPIAYTASPKPIDARQWTCDVAFYGNTGCERRQQYLEAIGRRFKTISIQNDHGDSLINRLKQARVIVNIHYYENALLETTRIFECLSNNMMIVSEMSRDQSDHVALDGIVEFTEIGDIEGMLNAISRLIDNDEQLLNRIKTNKQALDEQPQAFMACFADFMQGTDKLKLH